MRAEPPLLKKARERVKQKKGRPTGSKSDLEIQNRGGRMRAEVKKHKLAFGPAKGRLVLKTREGRKKERKTLWKNLETTLSSFAKRNFLGGGGGGKTQESKQRQITWHHREKK